ncbi:MAG TPA: hypothetical protein VGJ22_07820 [Anaerolineales bacterium]|jgi:hypothetical protein
MRKLAALLLICTFLAAACGSLGGASSPPDEAAIASMVAATMQALTQAAPAPQINGIRAEFANVSFVIPPEVADSTLAGSIPAVLQVDGNPWWDIAPAYIKFVLDRYHSPTARHEPQIRVYPTGDFAGAEESIHRLEAIIAGGQADPENLPVIPFFNAAQVFAAEIQPISFQNGSGLRSLTEYAQYPATVNNHDLFYHFQGLTQDGAYYIIAILPVYLPLLAADEKPDAFVPGGGVPFPGYDDVEATRAYYAAATELLNDAPAEAFSPPLSALDAMIQSLLVSPN